MAALKLYWLGHPVIEVGGMTRKMETRKATALLAYISLAEAGVPRELLAAMFWPEGDQQKAYANLRRNLSSIKERLPEGILSIERDIVTLKKGKDVWLDVDAFDKCLTKIKEHQHKGEGYCAACRQSMGEAVGYHRGNFMEGFTLEDAPEFDAWQRFQRQAHDDKYGYLLEKLVEEQSGQGHWEQAIDLARRWVALDAFNEYGQRKLMECYAAAGQRNNVTKQYQELRRVLHEQLGQEPEKDTTALYERLCEQAGAGSSNNERKKTEFAGFPLLKTKLYIPSISTKRVTRSSLVERLNEGTQKPLTVISAPAGFGKTTLLAEWIGQSDLGVAWVSLDAGDNDPYRFLTYLIAAMESVVDKVGDARIHITQTNPPPPFRIILASLINGISEIKEPSALVLDDYQFITEQEVHEIVRYLLDHLPPLLRVVIASRSDPPLHIGRMRLKNEVTELRMEDFRFTAEEAVEFFNSVMGFDLAPNDINLLESRTEGWVAGMQMAALSLQKSQDRSKAIQAFSGSNRFILDYLLEEVIDSQPKYIQKFLLQTSILGQMNGQLCDAVTHIGEWNIDNELVVTGTVSQLSSQNVLEDLVRANLFITSLDDEQHWYRYHHLFAELLSSRLLHSDPQLSDTLHRRAGSWFMQNAFYNEAMDHLIKVGDYESITWVIEHNALQMIGRGEIITLMKWISRLPSDLVEKSWILLRFKMWGLGFTGHSQQTVPIFSRIESILTDIPGSEALQAIHGEIALFRGVAAQFKSNYQEAIDQSEKALSLIPTASQRIRAIALFVLGDVYRALGELIQSEKEFIKAGRVAVDIGEFWTQIQAIWERAVLMQIQGQLHKAEELYQQAYQIASQNGMKPGSITMVDIGMSCLLYRWNKLDQARQLLASGVESMSWPETMHWWEAPYMVVPGCLILSRLARIAGDVKAADEAIKNAEWMCDEFDIFSDFTSLVHAERVRYWLEEGNLIDPADWLEKYRANIRSLEVYHEPEEMAGIRVLIALGKTAEAIDRSTQLIGNAEAGGRNDRLIEMLIQKALAFQLSGDTQEALKSLERSLILSRSEGYVRVYLDEGEKLQFLLETYKERCLTKDKDKRHTGELLRTYVDTLLSAFK